MSRWIPANAGRNGKFIRRTQQRIVALISRTTPRSVQVTMVFALLLASATNAQAPPSLRTLTVEVAGLTRTAQVYTPKAKRGALSPLVIAFHGHGGSGRNFGQTTKIHVAWPEAIVLYPDGLPAPGGKDPDGLKPGWQKNPGELDDRDLKFFDALVERAKSRHGADPKRIFAAGFSNGGRMTFLVWSARGKSLAGAAVCASQCLIEPLEASLTAMPALLIHGKKDNRLPASGAASSIQAVLKVNRAKKSFKTWPAGIHMETYAPFPGGCETRVITHPGGHAWPDKVTSDVVSFFKSQNQGG